MENNMIAQRIKELRSSKELTQAEFAESINATQAALSGYERGDRTPSLDILTSIAQKYKVSIDWLCGLSESQTTSLEPSTYSDLIKILFLLNDAPEIEHEFKLHEKKSKSFPLDTYDTLIFEINDRHIVEFYKEWQEISSVRKKTPSGDKLFAIWLKDIYERYNFKLETAKGSLFDDELPFN